MTGQACVPGRGYRARTVERRVRPELYLVADQPATLELIYKGLGLPLPPAFLNAPRSDAHRPHRPRHPALRPEVQQRLRHICAPMYAAGGYDDGGSNSDNVTP